MIKIFVMVVKIVLDSINFLVIVVRLMKGYFVFFLNMWNWKLKFVMIIDIKYILWSKLLVELIVSILVVW